MNVESLLFLAQPAFVTPWYGIGGALGIWVLYDMLTANRDVGPALKAAWPIIVLFCSVVGLAVYIISCRPRRIGSIRKREGDAEAKRVHHEFVAGTWKKVVGSDIHCVGGDGLGIMSAMVIARMLGFRFWPEFWTEYAVGFAFGWFVFQIPAMRHMGHSWRATGWKGGRAEFFSMATMVVGMGLVMRFVTPRIVGSPPNPGTAAFWGIRALGLMVGFIARGFPYMSSSTAPSPMASTLIDGGLAQAVAGLGAYSLYANMLYTDFTFYRAAPQGLAMPLDSTATNVVAGTIPYWRVALQHESPSTSLMVGTFGFGAQMYPTGVTGLRDHHADIAVDAQVEQRNGTSTWIGHASHIHERQRLFATQDAGGATNIGQTLATTRASLAHLPSLEYGYTLGYFQTTGTADPALYAPDQVLGVVLRRGLEGHAAFIVAINGFSGVPHARRSPARPCASRVPPTCAAAGSDCRSPAPTASASRNTARAR